MIVTPCCARCLCFLVLWNISIAGNETGFLRFLCRYKNFKNIFLIKSRTYYFYGKPGNRDSSQISIRNPITADSRCCIERVVVSYKDLDHFPSPTLEKVVLKTVQWNVIIIIIVVDHCWYCCWRWRYLLLGLLVLRPSIQVYYKVRQGLLQNATGITKFYNFITKCDWTRPPDKQGTRLSRLLLLIGFFPDLFVHNNWSISHQTQSSHLRWLPRVFTNNPSYEAYVTEANLVTLSLRFCSRDSPLRLPI